MRGVSDGNDDDILKNDGGIARQIRRLLDVYKLLLQRVLKMMSKRYERGGGASESCCSGCDAAVDDGNHDTDGHCISELKVSRLSFAKIRQGGPKTFVEPQSSVYFTTDFVSTSHELLQLLPSRA
jgi:hypothetical protein